MSQSNTSGGRKIATSNPVVETVYRVKEYEVEDGEAWVYRVEKEKASGGWAGYPSEYIVHAVEETRYTKLISPLKADTAVRYHIWTTWETDEHGWQPHEVVEEDVPASGPDDALIKTVLSGKYAKRNKSAMKTRR